MMILYSLYIIFHLELHITKRKVNGKKISENFRKFIKKITTSITVSKYHLQFTLFSVLLRLTSCNN